MVCNGRIPRQWQKTWNFVTWHWWLFFQGDYASTDIFPLPFCDGLLGAVEGRLPSQTSKGIGRKSSVASFHDNTQILTAPGLPVLPQSFWHRFKINWHGQIPQFKFCRGTQNPPHSLKNQRPVIGQHEKSKTNLVVYDWLVFHVKQTQGAGFWKPYGGLCGFRFLISKENMSLVTNKDI